MRCVRLALAVVAATALVACSGGDQPVNPATSGASGSSGGTQINGAGATFPNPIYSRWFSE